MPGREHFLGADNYMELTDKLLQVGTELMRQYDSNLPRQCRKGIWPIKKTTTNKEISQIWIHVLYVLHTKVCLQGARM